ncbi:MAG: type II toxin-antitoxin system mRNA interferase toxin, RelE/StbE family [bacterium]|nr:type II toxin-antitoxin system mRNA interferase toxin, RelE/StbE family [bacterium]
MKIFYHPRFKDSYALLIASVQGKAERKELIFRKNTFDPRLDTHKLHGRLKDKWSFSVDREYRILFEFDDGDVVFLDIGDHDLYK